jgi:transcriptional regulator with XRE-family HTH domain
MSAGRHDGAMSATQRRMARAKERSKAALREIGRELREARVARGLSQRVVALAIGVSQAQVSMIEGAEYPTVTVLTLWRFAAAVGLDLSLRAFPGGPPLRDKAHIDLLDRFRSAVGAGWRWFSEVPLPVPGDKRAWDRLMRGFGLVIAVEAETRPTDMQELGRRLALKKRDGGVDRLILVLPNSSWCRKLVALNELQSAFPVRSRAALAALQAGRDPGGDAIVLV